MSSLQVCKPAHKAFADYDRAYQQLDAETVIVYQEMHKGAVGLASALRHVELPEHLTSSHGLEPWNHDNEPLVVPGLMMERVIGTGAFATVYKGKWNNREIAVKVGQQAGSHPRHRCTSGCLRTVVAGCLAHLIHAALERGVLSRPSRPSSWTQMHRLPAQCVAPSQPSALVTALSSYAGAARQLPPSPVHTHSSAIFDQTLAPTPAATCPTGVKPNQDHRGIAAAGPV
jgi:hypothetical protein